MTDETVETIAESAAELSDGLTEGVGEVHQFDDDRVNHDDERDEPEREDEPSESPVTYKAQVGGRSVDLPAEHVDAIAAKLGMKPEDLLRGPAAVQQGAALGEALRSNPGAAIAEILRASGMPEETLYNFAIAKVQELMDLERGGNDPVERARLEGEQQRAQAEAELQQVYETKAVQQLNAEITDVLKSGQLPRDSYFVRRLASHMIDHLERGGNEDIHVADFLPLVLEEMELEHRSFLGRLSAEDLRRRFPALVKKLGPTAARQAVKQGMSTSDALRHFRNGGEEPARRPSAPPERSTRPAPAAHRRMSASEVLREFKAGR